MTCTCPKCTAEIELDVVTLPAEGSFSKCSACNTNLLIRKESFAKRALYKSTDIACAECGNPPGTSIYCQSCHAIYPEILVIETTSAAKKQLGKLLSSFNLFKNLKTTSSAKQSQHDVHSAPAATGKAKVAKIVGQPAQLATVLAVILTISIVGGYFWYQNKIANEYADNYVRTILIIKIAKDHEVNISNQIAARMKTGASSALTAAELKSTTSAKKDVDTLIARFGKVPAKFTASDDAIKRLQASFVKLHEAATNPVGTAEIYVETIKGMDADFVKSAGALKSGLPEKISAALKVSRDKHKPLKDF